MGGSSTTMLEFAKYARGELYLPSDRLENLCRSERYGLWKVGPLLVVAVRKSESFFHFKLNVNFLFELNVFVFN